MIFVVKKINRLTALFSILILITIIFFLYYIVSGKFAENKIRQQYDTHISELSFKYGVDSDLVYAVIKSESKFNTHAVSRTGAIGLMQIMPETGKFIADKLNIDFNENMLYNAADNLNFGIWYLSYLYKKFPDYKVLLCAYNAGEGNVTNWLKQYSKDGKKLDYIPFRETRKYVEKTMYFYSNYSSQYNI